MVLASEAFGIWRGAAPISAPIFIQPSRPIQSLMHFSAAFLLIGRERMGCCESVLANDGYGLVSLWTGFPNEPTTNTSTAAYDLMGSGGTIGDTYLAAQNRGEIYGTTLNQAETHFALLGDPTLRMHIVAPASNVLAVQNSSNVNLTWTASAEDPSQGGSPTNGGTFVGYHVYRASSMTGTFSRVSVNGTDLFNGTSLTIPGASAGDVYMVRAVKLEVVPSGTYYNLSDGSFSQGVNLVAAIDAGGSTTTSLGTSFAGDTPAAPSSHSNASTAQSTTISTTSAIDEALATLSVPVGTNPDLFKTAPR